MSIPAFKQIHIIKSYEAPNPNRRESLFLGFIAGPFNWPNLLLEYFVLPFIAWLLVLPAFRFGAWLRQGFLVLGSGLIALILATIMLVTVFPIAGCAGRLRRV